MKTKSAKIVGGILTLSLVGTIYSFAQTQEKEEPQEKNYEVIRMVDGKVTVCDTTVNNPATFTPDDYLKLLGFDKDKEINIIDLSNLHQEFISKSHSSDESVEKKMVFIEMDSEELSVDTKENVTIEKRIIQTSSGDGTEQTMDIDVLLEEINIDSIINSIDDGDGEKEIVISKVLISDNEGDIDLEQQEWRSIDTEGADYISETEDGNRMTKVAVWGDCAESTLVIVSNPKIETEINKASDKKMFRSNNTEGIETFNAEVYPNPAQKNAQIKLDFKTKAPTVLTITDTKGALIEKIELGDFSGTHTKEINLDNYKSGVYIINIQHGDQNQIERLIVE